MNQLLKNVLIDENELRKLAAGDGLSEAVRALLKQQKSVWSLLRDNYEGLNSVKIREFEFEDFTVKVQFNPARIKSSAAKVDKKSIQSRKSFLRVENLPPEQKGILFDEEYLILCNPYPIFPEHFTIPKIEQIPQRITGNFETQLKLAKGISKYYTVFYNGPKCGASAPDHLHFQAGSRDFMPIEAEYDYLIKNKSAILFESSELKVYSVKNYLRNFISLESDSLKKLKDSFSYLFKELEILQPNEDEPMMNILAYYTEDHWKVIIFPRGKHRPSQYFEDGAKKILLSPASVDMGGVCITPREEDFEKIKKEDVADILTQVTLDEKLFDQISGELSRKLNSINFD